jgi:leucyl aminopeptidase
MWALPLEEEYESYLDSPVADVRNTGKKREAGAIIAGLFLQKFVGDTPWAHLDIAGTAWRDDTSDYRQEGGVGYGVRTLLEYIQKRSGTR